MKGSQRILLLLLVIVILGAGAYLYFARNHQQYPPACMALPQSAVLAYQGEKTNAAFAAFQARDIYKTLQTNPAVKGFENDFRYFDSLVKQSPSVYKTLAASPLVASLHITSATSCQLLFLLQTQDGINGHDIEKLAKGFDPDERLLDHEYENVQVTEVLNSAKQPMFAFSFMDGILAISRNTGLVEEAVHAFHANTSHESALTKEMNTDASETRFYINYARLPDLFAFYTGADMSFLADIGSFGSYTWKAENDMARLSGTLNADKSSVFDCLQNQTPREAGLPEVLPTGTALFMDWCTDSFGAYFPKYKARLASKGMAAAWDEAMRQAKIATGTDPIKYLVPIIGNEWGYASMQVPEGTAPQEILAIKAKDSVSAYQNLKNFALTKGNASIEYHAYEINQISCGKAFALLLGDLFKNIRTPYFTKVGDYFLFSQSPEALHQCIDAYKDGKSLKKSVDYKTFSKSLVSKSNFYLYINPSRAINMGKGYASPEYLSQFNNNSQFYLGFTGFAFQLAANGTGFYNQITLAKHSEARGNVELAWNANLDASMRGKPQICPGKGVIVQDSLNSVYFFGPEGNRLWKRQFDEPIEGDAYEIDLFKNGQTEYLFATTNKIYLLDQDGKDVGGYPLNLAEPTSTGVAVFDYDNNKDYSYYISCAFGKIYGYNGNGRPLAGWLPKTTDATFSAPVSGYFDNDGKIYPYGVSQKGTFYIWNRSGKAWMPPVSLYAGFKNPFAAFPNSRSFSSVDTLGNLVTISATGSVKKHHCPDIGPNPFFTFINADEKDNVTYVMSSGETIAGYAHDSAQAWKLVTSEKIVYPPHVLYLFDKMYLNGKPFIGYISQAAAKLYMFSPLGISYPGFPVIGNTDFSCGGLNDLGEYNLVVGGPGKKLYCYRIED